MDIAKAGVANALTSKARDHIIAVANDIYDESLEKYQKDINKDYEDRITSLENGGSINLDNYITEDELDSKGYLTAVPEGYVTSSELDSKGYLTAVPEGYVTSSELDSKGYLTAVPEGYVTSSELDSKGYLTAVPEEYVNGSELASALESFKDSLEGLGVTGLTVDADKGWLRATGETSNGTTKNYFIALTELAKPNAPIIAEANRTKSVVTGSTSISVTNSTSGSTMYYRTYNAGNETWGDWTTVSSSFSLDSGFADDKDNESKTFKVQVKAIKNGEESDINTYDIVINPKCASGSITVVRNNNNNNWSTKATITLSPSASKGSKSEYSVDSGNTWTEFSKDNDGKYVNKIIEVESSTNAKVYKVRATKTGYVNSAISENIAFTLHAKKAYYGFSTSDVLTSESDIKSLIGGGVVEDTKLLGQYSISHTAELKEASANNNFPYVWLCCTDTLPYSTILSREGDSIPFGFNDCITVPSTNGWKCYRSGMDVDARRGDETYIFIPAS